MTINRRSILKGLGGTAAAATLAGCTGMFTGDDPEPLWHEFQDAEQTQFEEFLETFNDENETELGANSVNDMEDRLETSLPAGEGPVGFTWAHDWIGLYHDEGYLYDVADEISVDLESTYSQAAAQAVQWEGNVYGLPYAAETVTLMYNRDMVEEPPETISEMEAIMDDYHDPDDGVYGLAYPPTNVYHMSAWLQAFGGTILDDETGELGVDSDEVIEGGEFIEATFYDYVPSDSEDEAHETTFGDGNAPFTINGPWMTGEYEDDIDLGLAPLPMPDGGEPTPFTGIPMWYITAESEESDEETLETVIEFAEWYTTNDDVIRNNAENGMIPVHADHVGDEDLQESVGAFSETVDMGIPMPADARMDSVWAPMADALDRLFAGDESAADAFEAAADEIRDSWD